MLKILLLAAGIVALSTCISNAQVVIAPCGAYPYDMHYGCLYPESYVGRWWDGHAWHEYGWHDHWVHHHDEWRHHH